MKKYPIGNFVYEFECDQELTDSVLEEIKLDSNIHWRTHRNKGYSTGFLDHEGTVPYYNERLFPWINDCIKQVAADSMPGFNLKICDSWLVNTKFGKQIDNIHIHVNSVYSGIFYFTEHNRSETVFYPESYGLRMITNIFNFGIPEYGLHFPEGFLDGSDKFYSTTKKGKLLVFPANIPHNTSIHTDRVERYTLAFNTFVDSNIQQRSAALSLSFKSVEEKYQDYLGDKKNIKSINRINISL